MEVFDLVIQILYFLFHVPILLYHQHHLFNEIIYESTLPDSSYKKFLQGRRLNSVILYFRTISWRIKAKDLRRGLTGLNKV